MRGILGFVLLGFLLSGCSIQRFVIDPATPHTEYARINAALDKRHGLLATEAGDSLKGARFTIFPDSTVWHQGRRAERRVFPNSDVRRIVSVNRAKGSLRGLGTGLFAGSVTGALAGTLVGGMVAMLVMTVKTDNDPVPDSTGRSSPGHGSSAWDILNFTAGGAAAGGLLGGFIGLAVGSEFGDRVEIRFKFALDPPSRSKSR